MVYFNGHLKWTHLYYLPLGLVGSDFPLQLGVPWTYLHYPDNSVLSLLESLPEWCGICIAQTLELNRSRWTPLPEEEPECEIMTKGNMHWGHVKEGLLWTWTRAEGGRAVPPFSSVRGFTLRVEFARQRVRNMVNATWDVFAYMKHMYSWNPTCNWITDFHYNSREGLC